MDIRRTTIALAASASLCTHAAAQWTVTNLHPDGATESRAFATAAEQQVGYASVGGLPHAALWRGTATSWVDLHPTGGLSAAYDTDGTRQVGQAPGGAVMWSGTAASIVHLADGTAATAMSGTQVVGYLRQKFDPLPLLWEGTANPVYLPGGFAVPWDIADGVPVGSTLGGGRAILWRGIPFSQVSLHPAGAYSSAAMGTSGPQQVGHITIGVFGNESRASLWSGTAASWVSLHPEGNWRHSYARDIHGARQAGYATGTFSGANHACVWSGTPASWVDLHAFLPPEFTDSIADGIWTGPGRTLVVGYGENSATGRTEALLWTEETCFADCDGNMTLDIFDFLCFQDLFTAGDPAADCDGNTVLDVFDFLCFQDAFASGCR